MDRVRAAAIRTLFVQIRTSIASGGIVTAFVVATALPYTRWPVVAGWAAAMVAAQGGREVLRRRWHARAPADAALGGWVRAYTALMALAGVLWGLTVVLFAHVAEPITIALTLCALFGMCGGAVAGQAYNPAGLNALLWTTFGIVVVRFAATGRVDLIVLGVTCGTFAVAMTAFGRVQSRVLDDGFRIRFENEELVAALTHQTAEAEEARRGAERASLAKSQFLAAASHDLRQPLYALSLFSASLGELSLDAEGRGVVTSIQDSIAAMESLFEGLLDVSKLEAGVVVARAEAVAVDPLFDRISQVFRPIALERGLDLRFRSDGQWVRSDPVLLEQVLGNLVTNALRATRRGGVLVSARVRGGAVHLDVWDTGIGIAAADQERIFDEFIQLANPERDRRKGLGLGLAIARRAAALLGGAITIASRPGRGSRFGIAQPLAAASALPAPIAVTAPPPRPAMGDLPVLVIDDDRDVRAALGDLLARWGVACAIVADASAALAAVAAGGRYRLVLADYRLAGAMTGLDLLDAIAVAHPAPTPAPVLVTGDFDAAILAGADRRRVAVLHKPVDIAALRRLLGVGADAAPPLPLEVSRRS